MGKPRRQKPVVDERTLPKGKIIFSHRLLLSIGIVLWLALVFAYAGPMALVALYRMVFDGGVAILWLIAAAGIGSLVLTPFRLSESQGGSRVLMLVTSTAMGLGAISLLVLFLGLAGGLNQIVAVVILIVGIASAVGQLVRLARANFFDRWWLHKPAGWAWLSLVLVPIASLMAVGAMLPPYLLWTPQEPHGYDVVEYHLQVPREWFEAGRIIPLHHNVFSFFPFNVEMHYLLAMHLRGGPWPGMYLAQFMHGLFITLAALAVYGLAKRLWGNRSVAMVALLAMAGTPLLAQLGAIAYDEGGFLLFGTLAIGWAMIALRQNEFRLRRLALAGVMAGFACGSKLTAIPEVLVVIALVAGVVLLMKRISLAKAVAGVLTFATAALICFAPWLVRTWAWAGNPVFPELPQLGHGYFSQVQVARWQHAHRARPDQRSLGGRLRAGWSEIAANWQFGFLLIPTALITLIVKYKDVELWFLGAMLFLLALFWLGFTHLQGRFFVLAIPICALMIARLPGRQWVIVTIQVLIATVLLNRQLLTPTRVLAMHDVLGIDEKNYTFLMPTELDSIPPNANIVLVGDARAFLYQVPMSRLTYRTIFDADTTDGDVIKAWAGAAPSQGHQWLLIDPMELERFQKTYQPFPPLSADITAHNSPYLIQR